MAKVYYTDADYESMERMYTLKDKEMQVAAVSYMFGKDVDSAKKMIESGLSEEEIADSYEYFITREAPPIGRVSDMASKMRGHQVMYNQMKEERKEIGERFGLSPIDAVEKRHELNELERQYSKGEIGWRDRACKEYSRLQQNSLSSSAVDKMRDLDYIMEKRGFKFQMENEAAYMQPNALVAPRYALVKTEDQEFAQAVESLQEDGQQIGQ